MRRASALIVIAAALLGPGAQSALAVSPPTATVNFGANTIPLNGTTSLSITIGNPNPGTGLTGIGFTDTLPSGLVVATPNGLDNGCGGTLTAAEGSSTVQLSGASLAASTLCPISVNVKGTAAGEQPDVVTVNSSAGASDQASASLTVVVPPAATTSFDAGWFAPGETDRLSIKLSNPNSVQLTGVGLTDALNSGLVVADPAHMNNGCGGAAAAAAGAASIALSGVALGAGDNCSVSIDLTAPTVGHYLALLGTVSSNEGGDGTGLNAGTSVIAPGNRLYWGVYVNGGTLGVADIAPSGGYGSFHYAGAGHTATGVALDPAHGRMYWADQAADAIYYSDLDGSNQGQLDTTGASVRAPQGLAIDARQSRVYWANTEFNHNSISYASTNGTGGGDLDTSGASLWDPGGIAIDSAGGRVYWANTLNGAISYANLNDTGGGGDLDTGTTAGDFLRGLAIDATANRIYWVSGAASGSIGYASLDGNGPAGILDTSGAAVGEATGIAVDHETGQVYWANWTPYGIYAASTAGGSGHVIADSSEGAFSPGYLALLKMPEASKAPRIKGKKRTGAKLTCAGAKWKGDIPGAQVYRAPEHQSFAWTRNGKHIASATHRTNRAKTAGKYTCSVTAQNAAGSNTRASKSFRIPKHRHHRH